MEKSEKKTYADYNEYNQFLLETLRESMSETPENRAMREKTLETFVTANQKRISSVAQNLSRYAKYSSIFDKEDIESEVLLRCIERFLENARSSAIYETFFFTNVFHEVNDTLAKRSGPTSISRSSILRRLRNSESSENVPQKYSLDFNDDFFLEAICENNLSDEDEVIAKLDWEILCKKARLTPEERYALMAYYGLDMKQAEIAEQLDCKKRRVSYVLDRAVIKSRTISF